MNKVWFFYIVRCRDNSLYSGITNDLEYRIKQHNKGKGARYTAARIPVKLIYIEKYNNQSSACKREKQIKGWRRAKKELLIKDFPRLPSTKLGIDHSE